MSKDKTVFVSFNDGSDPTFTDANEVSLVYSVDNTAYNPCAPKNVSESCPVLPKTNDDIIQFCRFAEWDYDYDNNGQLIIYTGVNRLE